jgi:hypothetical protein
MENKETFIEKIDAYGVAKTFATVATIATLVGGPIGAGVGAAAIARASFDVEKATTIQYDKMLGISFAELERQLAMTAAISGTEPEVSFEEAKVNYEQKMGDRYMNEARQAAEKTGKGSAAGIGLVGAGLTLSAGVIAFGADADKIVKGKTEDGIRLLQLVAKTRREMLKGTKNRNLKGQD